MKWPTGFFSAVALLGLFGLNGCASITTDSLQTVSLTSDPMDAVCIITGPKGFTTRITTPSGFAVSRGEGDLNVVCTKAEKVGAALIKEEVAGMTFGNILFGGLIGVAVDAGTGKMWKYPSVGKVMLFDKDKQPKEPQIIATPAGQVESAEAKRSEQPTPAFQQPEPSPPAVEAVPTAFAPHPPKVEGPEAQHAVKATTRRPDVTINYPQDHAKIASESVTLAGIVTAPRGVARVNVAVNGSELPASRGITVAPAAGNTVPVNIRIPLQVGENVIVVTALDRSGEASQAVRTVYREGILPGVRIQGGAAPIPSAPTERWAVVIGIDQYKDPSIAQLQYGVADAKVFYEFLISKGGVKRSNVRLLLNKDATQVNIRRALGDFLKQKALKEDEVIIYYAGHGTTEPERGAEGGLAKYLVPWDADPNSLFATGIPMDEIDRTFSRLAARKILLVQDTCFSGGAGGRTFLRRGSTRASTLSDKFLQDLSNREGRMILTASDANQLSVESQEVGHGLFTYYLLQGLGGKADLDSDGAITVREIHLYLQRKVHDRSGGNQTPQLYSIGDMVIVRTK